MGTPKIMEILNANTVPPPPPLPHLPLFGHPGLNLVRGDSVVLHKAEMPRRHDMTDYKEELDKALEKYENHRRYG
jgi:hypothetical protein